MDGPGGQVGQGPNEVTSSAMELTRASANRNGVMRHAMFVEAKVVESKCWRALVGPEVSQ